MDGQTWSDYEANLEENLQSLLDRAKSGTYRAPPVRRVHIPKGGSKTETRPIGIPTIEDKVLQRAVVMILEAVYRWNFHDCSYGFRPGRSAHGALESLWKQSMDLETKWILDVDVQKFFDTLDHRHLRDLLRLRVRDGVILRLIDKWLRAGVLDNGILTYPAAGSPQGGVVSPLLSNVYLHYVFDLWIEWWRQNHCRRDVVVVRYAADFVIGFESHAEATACLETLRARFAKFGLELHEGKTRLIEFGRYAIERRKGRGEGLPETFDFLSFTHKCGQTRKHGWFSIQRHSMSKRMRAIWQAIKANLQKRIHRPLGETARWLRRVVQGWLNYHAIPGNSRRIGWFVDEVTRLWLQVIRRRSQRGRCWTWERMQRLVRKHLPRPRIIHPYPEQRFRARLKVRAV